MSAHDVAHLQAAEAARMLLAPLAANLDAVIGDLFALLMENRNHVGAGAAAQRQQQQLQRAGCGGALPNWCR